MHRVLHIPVRPELGLDILVAQQAHLGRQVLAVGAEQAPVEVDGRQQGHGAGREALGRVHRGRVEEPEGGPHGGERERVCVCV